jgi:hypothetical protein
MNGVRNLSVVTNLEPVARDLADLLARADNLDIAAEFPGTVARYSGDPHKVLQNLRATQESCQLGVQQQFIAFSGRRAVGMSAVRIADEVPEAVDPSWPNISGFVCNPYRNRGIGRLSLIARLGVVKEQFGGHAWAKVKKTNVVSQRMVTHAGFVEVGEEADSCIYVYRPS